MEQVVAVEDLGFNHLNDRQTAGDGVLPGLAGKGFQFNAAGGHTFAVAVFYGEGDDDGFSGSGKVDVSAKDGVQDRFVSGLPNALFLIAGDDCGRAVFFLPSVEGYPEKPAVFFHHLVDDSLRGEDLGTVSDLGVAKVSHRVCLGAIADFAGGELGVDERRDGFCVVQAQRNLRPLALDAQRVPLPRFDFAAIANRLLFFSVDGFSEKKPSAQSVNADGIVVLRVLPAEKDAGGLGLFAFQNFEANGNLKIFEAFFGIEEHRETALVRNPG